MRDETVKRHDTPDKGQPVMPFYIMCDVSWSMNQDMAALNAMLRRLFEAISEDPICNDIAQVCLMKFSDDASTVISLRRPKEALSALPELQYENGTNYSSAFRATRSTLEADIAGLKGSDFKVHRPVVFFLTDGEPNDEQEWYPAFQSTLMYNPTSKSGFMQHPYFVPIGFRDAEEDTLKKLAFPPEKSKWYRATTLDVDALFTALHKIILNTILTTGKAAQNKDDDPTADSGSVYQFPDKADLKDVDSGEGEYDPEFV